MRALLLALPLLLVGCQSGADAESADAATADAVDDPTVERVVVDDHGFTGVTAAELKNVARQAGADFVVVNFWASWCGPCREEMPAFVRFARESDASDVAVRFVTVDFPEALGEARAFLDEMEIQGDSYAQQGDQETFINDIDPVWTGSIPATVVYNRNGDRVDFWEGAVTYEELSDRLSTIRASSAASAS